LERILLIVIFVLSLILPSWYTYHCWFAWYRDNYFLLTLLDTIFVLILN